jgi:manganese/iron transport system substrate-binding protein
MFFYPLFRNLAALSLLTGLGSCASTPTAPSPAPTATKSAVPNNQSADNLPIVVVTHSVLCDLTQQIAATTINLKCLVAPGTDAHLYQPTPDDRQAIETGQLILYGGYDFEPSLIELIEATSSTTPKVAIGEVAVPAPQQLNEDGQTVTDPHVWHNARHGIAMAEVIRESLAKLAPNNAQVYADNTKKLTTELTQLDDWIKSQIATIPESSKSLVTTHDAFGYYSQAYGLPVEGALGGISTEEAPTASRVKELVGVIKTSKVPTIFAESMVNPKLIGTVANEAKVRVSEQELYADGLGEAGSDGETYQKMLMANTEAIVTGLGGQFTPFQPK